MNDKRHTPILDDDDIPDIDINNLPHCDFIQCVFSTAKVLKTGTGVTSRKHEACLYWFVRQIDAGHYTIQKINSHSVPSGETETINHARLIREFTPELAYYETTVLPAMENLEDIIDQGDEFREQDQLYSAEREYDRALGIDEKNIRALFGLGLIFLERKETERARELLAELVNIKSLFQGKNQHLFNEFGITLRKSGMFTEAQAYYQRALDFVSNDGNLYYNLGRACYENNDWEGCMDALTQSYRLDPELDSTKQLFKTIINLSEDNEKRKEYGKSRIPHKISARAKSLIEGGEPQGRGVITVQSGSEKGRARSGNVNPAINPSDVEFDDV